MLSLALIAVAMAGTAPLCPLPDKWSPYELEDCLESDRPLVERKAALKNDPDKVARRVEMYRGVFVADDLLEDWHALMKRAGATELTTTPSSQTLKRLLKGTGLSPLQCRVDKAGQIACREKVGCPSVCEAEYTTATLTRSPQGVWTLARTGPHYIDDGSCGCCEVSDEL